MRVAGIMSGTSLDGIDVAVVDLKGRGVETVAFRTTPYSKQVREALLSVSNCETHTAYVARLNFLLPELYARAFYEACHAGKVNPKSVELIGSHGQTIYHDEFCTLQIGDGSVLAERTGIPVVSDFRPADMAAGGKGAPLVPFVDYRLFRDAKRKRAAVNIGGIANVTCIPAGAKPEQVRAFDTGPGNMVVDQLAAHFSNGKAACDRGGKMAARGQVDPGLLAELLSAPYYKEKPPKTAGREQYGREFVAALLACKMKPEDLMATATALTAASIAEGIYACDGADDVIVSGGGVHNATLMRYLRAELPEMEVGTSDEYGIDPDAKEAIAFAILAHETRRGKPSNLPSATGARRAAVLGKLSLAGSVG